MMNRWSVPSGEEFQGYDEIRRNLLYYYGNIVTFKKKKVENVITEYLWLMEPP